MNYGQEELEPKDKNLMFEHKSESLCPHSLTLLPGCYEEFSFTKVTCVEKPWHV